MVFAAADHLMVVGHGNQIRLFIGGLNLIINRFGYRTENLMLQRFPGNQSHVVGAGYMPFIRQSVGIDKVAVLTAQLPGPFIHHFGEFLYCSANMYGQRIGGIVGRCQHHAVQTVLHGQHLALVQRDV